MSQIKVINGDLCIMLQKIKDDDVLHSYKLDNGAELDFIDGKLAQIVMPKFESQLNKGSLMDVPIDLVNIKTSDKKIIPSIKIFNDVINITLDCSTIIHKTYI